ncbi:MAG TPA: DNA polymerase III subunit delta [Sphingomicrobium sp.]|nr:DNA polymerase III subunit delta [Sphingomicrobium sp.]
MRLQRGAIGRAVDQPDSAIRFYLLYGPDEAQSRALGMRLVEALQASRSVIAGADVKSDPAMLADEAGAMSLFGGKRVIWIEPAGDEIAPGVQALLEASAAESPAVAIGGSLRKTSALLKLAEGSPTAVVFASYVPEGRDAERMVANVGRILGLKLSTCVAERLAEACAGDQAIATRELEKLALYIGASPQMPRELTDEALDAVGAALPERNFARLADLALGGDMNALANELGSLSRAGAEAIPAIRALQRRLLMLAPARARVERGESAEAVMTSMGKLLFWKDKPLIAKLLDRWDSAGLATAAERAGRLERELMFSDSPPAEALGEELVAIAHAARRR